MRKRSRSPKLTIELPIVKNACVFESRFLELDLRALREVAAQDSASVSLRRLLALLRVLGVTELHVAHVCREFGLLVEEPLAKDQLPQSPKATPFGQA